MANITLHITSGIAAYKVPELLRLFQKNGDQVRIAMTEDATQFVTPVTLNSLTKDHALVSLWDQQNPSQIAHIELADWTDVAIVVPATADIIAKMANGIADDAVSTTLLATDAPKLVVPAMNMHMWENPATIRNITQLKSDGIIVLEPDSGYLAEGYSGKGRMPSIQTIFTQASSLLDNDEQPLLGKKVVVTAGGTREAIDPVRFIGNRSSGKMGIALALSAAKAGAKVELIVGQVSVPLPVHANITVTNVTSSEEMAKKVTTDFQGQDILIMAAAVADFRPAQVADQKIKKDPNQDLVTMNFTKTPDILKLVAKQKKAHQFVVAFAAETQNLLENAEHKLESKGADMLVANNVASSTIGFGSDDNQVTLFVRNRKSEKWATMAKSEIADQLIKRIAESND